jgi:hypothetical protein
MEIWRNLKNYIDYYGSIMELWRNLTGFKGNMEELKQV